MNNNRGSRVAVVALALLSMGGNALAAGAAQEGFLTGPQIRAAIAGKSVGDERHWEHKYFADGRLERSESGRHKAGRWSVQDDRLCLLKPEIDPDRPLCFRVLRHGDQVEYHDDRYAVYRGVIRRMTSAPAP
ncbi:MAG TPA: hypothetical protein VFU71_16545 [Burkholderiaceae bacterium]|nr:hypothetical protein [Burkholderiaceae bacterium]